MTRTIEGVDHMIPKEEAVFGFGPEMKPVLEVEPWVRSSPSRPTTVSPARYRPRTTW